MEVNMEKWRQDLLKNPPRSLLQFDDWEDIIKYELIQCGNAFYGENNGNYGNPTGYSHNEATRKRISENNSRYWLGKEVPWMGKHRPDSVEIARKMGKANKGKPSWNKGMELGPHSDTHRAVISEKLKGRKKETVTCPHCGKKGGKPVMARYHFDNCKVKK